MKHAASILLVDDHPVFRQGLATILRHEPDLKIVAEAGDGQIALDMMRAHAPDLVVMDISMPNLDGIEATRQILAEFPGTKIVALSVHSGKRFVRDMLQAGAVGYILKESVPEEMIDGIRTVLAGEVYLSKAISGVVVSLLADPDHPTDSLVEPIVHTKLHRPPVPAEIIPRVHLLNVLEEGRQRTMTLISAPAGYGKSLLASQWLDASQCRSAWLSLDEGENDLRRFVRYLLEAIHTIVPTGRLQSTSLLQAASVPPVKVVARYLLNDLGQIDEPFVLVLDEYHRISQMSVHELVNELLQYPSPRLHLALLTRRDPPLPLGHLRAQGQVTELTMEHLRFSVAETRTFLERVLPIPIDAHTAAVLEEKMEGWVTGLRLAALSCDRSADPEDVLKALAASSYYAQDYLIEEVLSHVPPAVARLLLETSLLDRFCAPLCDVLRRAHDIQENAEEAVSGQMFIEWLEQSHLFVIPLDETHHWFRYHHLFQQLLQHQLRQQRGAEEIARLHLQASTWFGEHGLIDAAIRHALAAGDVERAVVLVEQHRQAILNEDRVYVLEHWLTRLPDTVKTQRPALLLAQAWVSHYHFKVLDILPLVDAVESLVQQESAEDPLQGEVAFFRGYWCLFQGEGARSLEYLSQALDRIPVTHHLIRGEAEIVFALASHMEGQRTEAVQTLEDVLVHQHALTSIRKTRVLAGLVFLKLIAAECDDTALMYTQQLYDVALNSHYDYANAWGCYLRGLLASARHDQEAAIAHFRQAVEQRYILHTRAAIDALAGLSWAYQFTHQTEQATATLALLFEFVRPFHDPTYVALAESWQARLSLMQGKLGAAVRWLTTTTAPAAEVMLWWLEVPAVTACRVLLAEGSDTSLQDAEQRLQEYCQLNQAHHNTCQMIEILTLLALTYTQQDRRDDALAALKDAVNLAEAGGYIRPFVELGPPMVELFTHLRGQHVAGDVLEQILAALTAEDRHTSSAVSIPVEPSSASPADGALEASGRHAVVPDPSPRRVTSAGDQAWIVESLTDRELEVLDLLGQRLYNKEIAEQLAVTPETIKTHLSNIYQKLNVTDRRQAVTKARELGILSSPSK